MQRDNPFKVKFEQYDKSIDEFIKEIDDINKMRWQFMTWYQILFLPITNLIIKWEDKCIKDNIYCSYDEPYHLLNDRRKPENALMRKMYDRAKERVQYHMTPKTVLVDRDHALPVTITSNKDVA